MNRRLSIALVSLACLTPFDQGFAQVRQIPLADRIQATFRATDVDKNGTISPQEAAKAKVPARSFAAYDKNKDRRLSSDEFADYYQNLIASSRAERERKAAEAKKKADEAKRKAAADKAKKAGAKDAAKNGTTRPTLKPGAGQGPNQNAPASGVPAHGSGPNVTGVPVPAASDSKAANKAPAKAPTKEPVANPEPDAAQLLQSEQRARTYVQRLLAKGSVTVQEASDMYQSLDTKVSAPAKANQIVEWRAALNKSRERVTSLVRAGSLTAEEGREMYQLFEVRARRAVLESPKKEPVKVPSPVAEGVGKPDSGKPGVAPVADSLVPRKAPAGSTAKDAQQDAHQNTPGPANTDALTGDQAAKDKAAHDAERAANARAILRTNDARAKLAEQSKEAERLKGLEKAKVDRTAQLEKEAALARKGQSDKDQLGQQRSSDKDQGKQSGGVPSAQDQATQDAALQKRMQDARVKKRLADADRRILEQKQAEARRKAADNARAKKDAGTPGTGTPSTGTPSKGAPSKGAKDAGKPAPKRDSGALPKKTPQTPPAKSPGGAPVDQDQAARDAALQKRMQDAREKKRQSDAGRRILDQKQAEARRKAADDARKKDSGTKDAGTKDAGTQDAGTQDAGTQDAGTQDAGTKDAGTKDAGTKDTGKPKDGVVPGAKPAPKPASKGDGQKKPAAEDAPKKDASAPKPRARTRG